MPTGKELDIKRDSPSSAFDLTPEFERFAERFFGDRFSSLFGDWPVVSRRAIAEIRETKDGFVLCADIPGIPKENIDVSVSGNLLTIRAEHKEESGGDKDSKDYRRQYRSLHQSFSLPSNVNPDQIEANCENGVLEVWIPKAEESQPKKIELKSFSGKTGRNQSERPPPTEKH